MTMITRFMVIALVAASALYQPAFLTYKQDQTWRNIKLLHSTRADVEKELRQTTEASAYVTRYSLQNYELWVDYYPFDHCHPKYGKVGEWNVPEWTVTEITYIPGETVPFKTLNVDLRQFKKVHESPDVPDMLSYINENKGVAYTLESDKTTLHSIRYFPSSGYKGLQCEEKPALSHLFGFTSDETHSHIPTIRIDLDRVGKRHSRQFCDTTP